MPDIYALIDYLRRYFTWINLLVILTLSYLLASLFSGFLSRTVSQIPLEMPMVAEKSPSPKKSARPSLADYRVVTERNIFCSLPEEKEETEIAEVVDKSPLNARLIGTVTGPPDSSLALIEDRGKRSSDFYQIGDSLMGQATILAIERNRVIISRAGVQESLLIYEEEITALAPPSQNRGSTQTTEQEENTQFEIRQVTEDSFEIDRFSFEEATKNLGNLMTQARVVPHFVEGKISGYKIFAIEPGSIYTEIGMANGDIIQNINGIEIDSPEKALQLLAQLKNETNFQIDLVRNGQPKTYSYQLR